MGDVRHVFLGLLTHLEKYANDDNFSQHIMAASISHKIEDYWMIMNNALTISAILNPQSKLLVFSDESKVNARIYIQSIYELYKMQSSSPTNLTPPTPIRRN